MSFYYTSSGYSGYSWYNSYWSKYKHHDNKNDDWCYTSIAPVAKDDPGSSKYSAFLGSTGKSQSVSDWKLDGVSISATDINGNKTHASLINCEGIGVDAGCDKTGQLEYNAKTGQSESITISFDQVLNKATVGISKLSGNEGGHWEAYYEGNLVTSGDFYGNKNCFKELSIDTGDLVFDEIVFTASDNVYGYKCDVSDYLIKYISVSGPAIAEDAFTVQENGSLALDANTLIANDCDDDTPISDLVISDYTDAVNGTISFDEASGQFTYVPGPAYDYLAAGETATDTFTYAVKDPEGNVSNYATVTITIIGENDAPVAADDTLSVAEDAPLVIQPSDLLVNDSDPEGDNLTITAVGNPSNGTVVLNADGTITFTPAPNYSGPATFEYTVSDGNGGETTATVTVNVTPENDGPVAAFDNFWGMEDTPVTVTPEQMLGNDTDLDGDTLTITEVSNPTNGTVVLNADGTVTFTPDENFNGEATYEYTITDGNGGYDTATVTIDFAPVNDAPVAVDDQLTGEEDTTITLDPATLLGNDTDVDGDPLTITAVSNPSHGTVTLNPDGTVSFTPDPDYNGPATFDYTVSDGNGGEDTATVTVVFSPVNDGPDAVDDSFTGEEDTPYVMTPAAILGNDTDPEGDTLSITGVSNPTNGTVVLNADGTITFTPDADFVGEATYDYTITDGNGGTDTATVTIDFAPMNDAPDAVDDAFTTNEDTPLTLTANDLLGNDSDPDGDMLSIVSVSNPKNGSVILNQNGSVLFIPAANFFGEATFEYTITDGNGGYDTAEVTITVASVNDIPCATPDSFSAEPDQTITFPASTLLANDVDPDGDTLSIFFVSNATNGTATLNDDGTVTFEPTPGYIGEATFDYMVTDGNGGYTSTTVTIDYDTASDQIIFGDEYDNLLTGGAGNDQIYGCEGDDIIYGGAGADTLVGGEGNDTIYMGDDMDADTLVTNFKDLDGSDTVYQFGDEDILDFADLLQGSTGDLSDYLHFEFTDEGDTIIEISSEGLFANNGTEDNHDANVDHTIRLADTELACGCADDSVIIDYLLANNQLQVDLS
ncbi:cadherin-like domain-containing protein [Neptunomonas phycophila]|uniref:cadherin-like domain-containing protein n=1 Tax=Neptunomonas phycophila TaxID=1572645 RepID=UPI0009FAD61F|nr:Ig-like domain-containing protein [Neptunomonas phycophila]